MDNQHENLDSATTDEEGADATRSHVADRPATPEEERLADEAAQTIDLDAVAVHEREMDELGAAVKGEGEIG